MIPSFGGQLLKFEEGGGGDGLGRLIFNVAGRLDRITRDPMVIGFVPAGPVSLL